MREGKLDPRDSDDLRIPTRESPDFGVPTRFGLGLGYKGLCEGVGGWSCWSFLLSKENRNSFCAFKLRIGSGSPSLSISERCKRDNCVFGVYG